MILSKGSSGSLRRRRIIAAHEVPGLRLLLVIDQTELLRFLEEKLFEPDSALELLGFGFVVGEAVDEDLPHVVENLLVAAVLHPVDAGTDGAEVHGAVDDLVVVGSVRLGDGPVKRPPVFVSDHEVEQVVEQRRVEDGVEFVVDGAASLRARLRRCADVRGSSLGRPRRRLRSRLHLGVGLASKPAGRPLSGGCFTAAAVARFLKGNPEFSLRN